MGQHRDAVEAHHAGRALDRMDQAEGLVQVFPIGRVLFERQQGLDEVVHLLLGFVKERLQILAHVVGATIAAVLAVGHGVVPLPVATGPGGGAFPTFR